VTIEFLLFNRANELGVPHDELMPLMADRLKGRISEEEARARLQVLINQVKAGTE
jgi:hypothetical protein